MRKTQMMTKVTLNGHEFDSDAVANLMDDGLREELHAQQGFATEQEFLDAYIQAHRAKFDEDFVVN